MFHVCCDTNCKDDEGGSTIIVELGTKDYVDESCREKGVWQSNVGCHNPLKKEN